MWDILALLAAAAAIYSGLSLLYRAAHRRNGRPPHNDTLTEQYDQLAAEVEPTTLAESQNLHALRAIWTNPDRER